MSNFVKSYVWGDLFPGNSFLGDYSPEICRVIKWLNVAGACRLQYVSFQ